MHERSKREVNYDVQDGPATGALGRLGPRTRDALMVAIGLAVSTALSLVLLQRQGRTVEPAELQSLRQKLEAAQERLDMLDGTVRAREVEIEDLKSQLNAANRALQKLKPSATEMSLIDIQGKLKERGYYTRKLDGEWGPNTSAAVARFQRDSGLPPSGQLDEATKSRLKALR